MTSFFCKPAKDGSAVSWHQDYAYWTWTKPLAHLTCWVGLDDVSAESGCLWYVPGSHTWGLLPTTGLAGDMEMVTQVLNTMQAEQLQNCRVPAELSKGYASFHHPLTMHGSYGNTSSNERRATAIHVMRDGVVSNRGKRDMGKFPAPPTGAVMQGPCYPLLIADGAELSLMSKAAGEARNAALPLDLAEFDAMMLQALRQRLQAERRRRTTSQSGTNHQ